METDTHTKGEQRGERLLSAVEMLVDDSDNLIAEVEIGRDLAHQSSDESELEFLERVAMRIVRRYSTRSAFVGGLSALSAAVPGAGTAVALVGGSLADMTFMLKHEVEMCLCLTYLYGYDIREEGERWLAYALAAVSTYEAHGGRNYFVDLSEIQLEALRKYTPRQLSKLAIVFMGRTALLTTSRSLARVVPLLGVGVCAAANKLVTTNVGYRALDALARRHALGSSGEAEVVDAKWS